ncbi:probable 4-coumarate--CoA ligase 1 [Musca vetustissima]|uniref:probable 4-coumarate--CoA ligase 1 n=1 Tax=Musca vetustissima TaxID=27455 RepID=UPI002AB60F36|nr:probable 4-coumarate--CoA ligase 1 [Musca vetustissima]
MSDSVDISVFKTFYDPETKIWRGEKTEYNYNPEDSIASLVLKKLLENPDNIGQVCYQTGNELTNMEIAKRTVQVAKYFEKLQLQQCDMIGLCASNTDYIAPLVFGALASGLCISTLDPSFDKDGIKHVYSLTKPRMMFCDGQLYEKVREALDECGLTATKIYTMCDHIEGVPSIMEFFEDDSVDPREFRVPPLKEGVHQSAFIVCTSGTTGLPKGVCISHATFVFNTYAVDNFNGNTFLCFSTLYWVSGLFTLIQGTLGNARRIISTKAFNVDDFFDIVQRYKVNIIMVPPSQIALAVSSDKIAQADLSSLSFCMIGGSAVSYALTEKFRKYAPNAWCVVGYGSSETSGIAVTPSVPNSPVGTLVANVEVRIIDDDGNSLGPNETGELCVRTPLPWKGYYGNPTATKEKYDADGWIYTGDVGYFNDEGVLFLVDRKCDIRKYNNFHFSPTDIELVISELPQVADVCVVGIPHSVHGFLPAACVIKRPDSEISESEIYQYVVDRMQDFEHLRGGVYFVESFPETPSGKVIRRKVAEMCEKLWKEKNGSD